VTKIRVKIGAAEAEVDADPDHLKEAIDLIPALAAKLSPAGSLRQEFPIPASSNLETATQSGASLSQLPTVTLEKTDSLSDVIGKFFGDPWGREKRKLSDVREALQSYGLNYPKQSVAVALLRLAKATRIRRFKAEDGEFVYTVSGPVMPAQATRVDLPLDALSELTPN
jgi:hypothetical protein